MICRGPDRRDCAGGRKPPSTGFSLGGCGACLLLLATLGCSRGAGQAPLGPPLVSVAVPIERTVTDYKDFTGRTDAPQSVSVRARVSGYLLKIPFKEGAEIKEGDVLFEIDVRPYKAILEQAIGQLQQSEANTALAQANYDRALHLNKTPGVITKQDLDTYVAQLAVAKAQTTTNKAAIDAARLNVEFCTVRSPIDGRIGRYLITTGNLVTQDQTLLTTIVSQDPIYGYFDVDERTMLEIQQLIREGKMQSARENNNVPVMMGLANEPDFPHHGAINFVDNRVDPTTGTLQVRGVFPNPAAAHEHLRTLSPGLFIRVRVDIGAPYKAVLVNERAVGTDQGQSFVFVVDDKDVVEYRKVTQGERHGGLRALTSGLSSGERVVVSALLRVHSGLKVRAKVVDMPQPTMAKEIQPPASDQSAPPASPATKKQGD